MKLMTLADFKSMTKSELLSWWISFKCQCITLDEICPATFLIILHQFEEHGRSQIETLLAEARMRV